MGRAAYRASASGIKTAEELSILLPIPIYRILTGTAQPVFPGTDRSNPSWIVTVISTKSSRVVPSGWLANLPLIVNGTQWESVAVPVLQDPRVSSRGLYSGGSPVNLSVSVVAPLTREIATTSTGRTLIVGTEIGEQSPARLSVTDLFEGDVSGFLELISQLILITARSAGY